ncbi:class I SAM-dependent methyltransferase [Saccharicrinis sp. 156]|uniref:class I SAM-dependent methyltransferase n=1 Tax=Saccharicrinis sp. 156 TaxID=3417574 RepID=UPI003D3496CF
MMSFYSSIVKAYDEIFPLNKVQANLIEELFQGLGGKRVLDCGCGTGSLAIELGRRSANVDAFDLDESMVAKAETKRPQALNVNFAKDDLLRFSDNYKKDSYDVAYCLGNTLAHLPSLEEVGQYINAAASVLKPGAFVLVQVVNFDRVISNKISQLPTIESENYVFERNYIPEEHGVIQFSTVLKVKRSVESYTQSLSLIPILKEDLVKMLSEQFEEVQFFGSFKKEKWLEDSFHTVVLAKKRTGQSV